MGGGGGRSDAVFIPLTRNSSSLAEFMSDRVPRPARAMDQALIALSTRMADIRIAPRKCTHLHASTLKS